MCKQKLNSNSLERVKYTIYHLVSRICRQISETKIAHTTCKIFTNKMKYRKTVRMAPNESTVLNMFSLIFCLPNCCAVLAMGEALLGFFRVLRQASGIVASGIHRALATLRILRRALWSSKSCRNSI